MQKIQQCQPLRVEIRNPKEQPLRPNPHSDIQVSRNKPQIRMENYSQTLPTSLPDTKVTRCQASTIRHNQ